MQHAGSAMPMAYRPRSIASFADARRRFAQLRYLVFHHFAHARHVRAMGSYAERGITAGGWFEDHKYLGEYFARSFSPTTRRDLILAHYRFVESAVQEAGLARIGDEGVELWRHDFDEHTTSIRLATSRFAPMEGEWQLQYRADDVIIGTLSFAFGKPPGFEGFGGTVCLIGGVQGGRDCREAIRVAAKGNHEIAATSMLVIAVRAIAEACGVGGVFGVSGREQVFGLYSGARVKADYDALWIAEGASSQAAGFFALSHDRNERDLGDISRSHRRRTKRKRERKAEIMTAIVATTRQWLV